MDDLDVGVGGEDFLEEGKQGLVEFDGEDAGGVASEVAGETAQAGADLQDGVGGGDVADMDDFFEDRVIGEEVLAEAFLRSQAVETEEIRDVEGGKGVHRGILP